MIKNFEEFLRESVSDINSEVFKIADFKRVCLVIDRASIASEPHQEKNLSSVYNVLKSPSDYTRELFEQKAPVLVWGMRKADGSSAQHEFCKELAEGIESYDGKYPVEKIIYNPGEVTVDPTFDGSKKWDKVAVAKSQIGEKSQWVPQTVFSKEAAKKLKFPLIAKKKMSFQSKGVEKIDDEEQLEASNADMYQEMIDIDKEYRVVIFKGKNIPARAIALFRREPVNAKAKHLRVDENDTGDEDKNKAKFRWCQLSPSKLKMYNIDRKTLKSVVQWCQKHKPLNNVYGLDIAVDKKGKTWFIELNGAPGFCSNWSLSMYKEIFEDWYKRKISREAYSMLGKLGKLYSTFTKEDYSDFRVEDADSLSSYNFDPL